MRNSRTKPPPSPTLYGPLLEPVVKPLPILPVWGSTLCEKRVSILKAPLDACCLIGVDKETAIRSGSHWLSGQGS